MRELTLKNWSMISYWKRRWNFIPAWAHRCVSNMMNFAFQMMNGFSNDETGAQLLSMGGEFVSVMNTWQVRGLIKRCISPDVLGIYAENGGFMLEMVGYFTKQDANNVFDRVLDESYGPFGTFSYCYKWCWFLIETIETGVWEGFGWILH